MMASGFAEMQAGDAAPDLQLVIDTYLNSADMPSGKRPTRTFVGFAWGVDELNALAQSRQDALLKEMQHDTAVGRMDTYNSQMSRQPRVRRTAAE